MRRMIACLDANTYALLASLYGPTTFMRRTLLLLLLLPMARTVVADSPNSFGTCVNLTGSYVYNGEDGNTIATFLQKDCKSIVITDPGSPKNSLSLTLDGKFRAMKGELFAYGIECKNTTCMVAARPIQRGFEVLWYPADGTPSDAMKLTWSLDQNNNLVDPRFSNAYNPALMKMQNSEK